VEIEALRAQLAAAEEQLMKNQEEKNAVAKELEQAQKEKADQQRKKAFLDETGLTEAEFEDKKAMVEGRLMRKVEEMKGRRVALERALERCPVLSKEVIGGSMKVQKDIQEKMGLLKALIDERQKVMVTKVKQMEEEKLCEIQNASSELRAARGKIVDRINTTNSLLFDSDVYEIFDRAEEEERQLDLCLTQEVDFSLKTDTEYACEVVTDSIQDLMVTVLDFGGQDDENAEGEAMTEDQVNKQQATSLRDQIRALEKEKKICVASEDFLEAAAIKNKIDELAEELEGISGVMGTVEDEREARMKLKEKNEMAENYRNWDAVKYKKTVRQGKESEAGLLNFLF